MSTFKRTHVADIELADPPAPLEGLEGYLAVKGLVRLHGTPLGYVDLPVVNNGCSAAALRKAVLEQHSTTLLGHLLENWLASPTRPDLGRVENLFVGPMRPDQALPLVTVAVCTRDRTDSLALCLPALERLDYPHLDLLVVDNAPTSDATERLVRENHPRVRYVREPRPGIDWARNRAILEARGEIIAYTDDDVIVDPGWVRALANVFAEDPGVMAVTGLTVPYELETEAQLFFELHGGFGRGFERRWYQLDPHGGSQWKYYGTGQYGAGANMAYRRSVFDQIGPFDPALDVGTVTNGGGDLEMFFRVIKEGHLLVYEPGALVRHRHRRDYASLQKQIANNGVGCYSYFVRSALAYPRERAAFIKLGLWWLFAWHIRRVLGSFLRPKRLPHDLAVAELRGCFVGLGRYQKARRIAAPMAQASDPARSTTPAVSPTAHAPVKDGAMAVRTLELSQGIAALADVADYKTVRVFVTWRNQPLGSVDFVHHGQTISAARLRKALVDNFGFKLLLEADPALDPGIRWTSVTAALSQRYLPAHNEAAAPPRLPREIPVSIVVATLDRPDDLRVCLGHLQNQVSPRTVEIVVVDNHPASGLTPPVVAEFANVVLVSEPRQGLAYARNAGFTASRGQIVVATDDDVVTPPDWLETLVAPFVRSDVMVVTGNTLPRELETSAQCFFEAYGGLGRGFKRFEVDGDWFENFWRSAVPTWTLGATANAAFRASIFTHPKIGLMDEALGPGMPSGVGEDTYLFYKVLKAGYTLFYEPTAYVWHTHRRTMPALRRQLYAYSKGHVAYHLTTLSRDGDLRALVQLVVHLPMWRCKQILGQAAGQLLGRGGSGWGLLLLEIKGNLAGPWVLWRSRRRVKREGRSSPYVPFDKRARAAEIAPREPAQRATVNA